MENDRKIEEIYALKNLLSQSDHVTNKIVEKIVLALEGATTITVMPRLLEAAASALSDYKDILTTRAELRAKINSLEDDLDDTSGD